MNDSSLTRKEVIWKGGALLDILLRKRDIGQEKVCRTMHDLGTTARMREEVIWQSEYLDILLRKKDIQEKVCRTM